MTTRPLPVQPQFKENAGSDETPIKGDKKRGKRKQRKQGTPKHDDGDQVIYTASWWQVIAAAWNANSEADEQKVRESRYYNTLQV